MNQKEANIVLLAQQVRGLCDNIKIFAQEYKRFRDETGLALVELAAKITQLEGRTSGAVNLQPTDIKPEALHTYPVRTLEEGLDYIRSFASSNRNLDFVRVRRGVTGWEVAIA